MFVADVVPIARGAQPGTLTYFSASPVAPGALVEITLRNRLISGLVTSVRDAREAKADLRRADFALQKIERVIVANAFSAPFMTAVAETAEYFAGSIGAVLRAFVPEAMIARAKKRAAPDTAPTEAPHGKNTLPERLAIQSGVEERFAHYRSVIRSEFAKGRSVLIILPTIEEARRAAATLEKGIESYTVLFHGKLRTAEADRAFVEATKPDHPILLVGTWHTLAIARTDLGVVIVERESSPVYKLPTAPFPDVRFFAERYARAARVTLVLGDTLLRIETAERVHRAELAELAPLQWRSLTPARVNIVDMRTPVPEPGLPPHQRKKTPFQAIGEELGALVRRTHEESARMILFANRKGLAPTTVCIDCNTVVTCAHCAAPVTLRLGDAKSGGENYFVCNRCGARRSAAERCSHCDGWRLEPLGIGIERVERELKERFPDVRVIRIDKDRTRTSAEAERAAAKFRETPGSILLGTELALLYASAPVEYVGVASIDSLFALPDYRIPEKAFSILLRLRSLALSDLAIQTRLPQTPLFEHARAGNLIDFFREEMRDRKEYGYPPEKLLIKLSAEGTRESAYARMEELTALVKPAELEVYPAFIKTVRGKFILHGLIRLDPSAWPNDKLTAALAALPRDITVRVDPESLL